MVTAETPLAGGRTQSAVVRVGDTVRRELTANAEFVRALLRHLDAFGFAGAPRYLGSDDTGREVFSYRQGKVPAELGRHDDTILREAARLICRYHNATPRCSPMTRRGPSASKSPAITICRRAMRCSAPAGRLR